jgi:NAD-reducing hydrogenase small subunit
MSEKVTVASDWLAGCAGCHMSFLDIDQRLVSLLELVELRATPITDLKQPDEQGVDVGMLEGAVANSSTEEVARRMRSRCKTLIALGDCAVFGGVPAMRNAVTAAAALRRAYVQTESTVDGMVPQHEDLAVMQEVRPLDQTVPVDIYLPGCPPSADAIYYVLSELAQGRQPKLRGRYLDWH